AKNVGPLPPSQNTRGRTTARRYPGRSAQASPLTSFVSCQWPPPSSEAVQPRDNGPERNVTASVAPRVERFSRNSRPGPRPGRRDRRLTTPPIAPAPYNADATPLMTSTCPRSIGGILPSPTPPPSPTNRNPPENTRVYRPRIP